MTIDITTNTLMQQIQNPILTFLSKLISIATEPKILILTAIVISISLYLKKQKTKAILLTTTTITTGLIIIILKEIIKRPRPLNALVQETSFSFPSGHTIMTVVFFGLITYIYAKKQKLSYIIITIIISTVALARIYLRVHWLTDIIFAIVFGAIILLISTSIYEEFISH